MENVTVAEIIRFALIVILAIGTPIITKPFFKTDTGWRLYVLWCLVMIVVAGGLTF